MSIRARGVLSRLRPSAPFRIGENLAWRTTSLASPVAARRPAHSLRLRATYLGETILLAGGRASVIRETCRRLPHSRAAALSPPYPQGCPPGWRRQRAPARNRRGSLIQAASVRPAHAFRIGAGAFDKYLGPPHPLARIDGLGAAPLLVHLRVADFYGASGPLRDRAALARFGGLDFVGHHGPLLSNVAPALGGLRRSRVRCEPEAVACVHAIHCAAFRHHERSPPGESSPSAWLSSAAASVLGVPGVRGPAGRPPDRH
jgi:hypothetical protein